MNVLAVDIGGTHIKFRTQNHPQVIKLDSGPNLTPDVMTASILEQAKSWKYDRVSIGYPGPVVHGVPFMEPRNLGPGWLKFDLKKALGNKPTRILNDAAMQALGGYKGGRMLFLGLGTGLGSAMVVDGVVQAMELAHLPWKKGKTYEEYLGVQALKKSGKKKWRKNVFEVIELLQQALTSEYVLLGGGNAKFIDELPSNVLQGSNADAFRGAFAIWNPKKSPCKR